MPPQWKINIVPGPPGFASFVPPSLECQINDQIYWANADGKVHWPALRKSDGTLDENYFLEPVTGPDGVKRNELAPNTTSATFSPGVAGALSYVCLWHRQETGVIKVLGQIAIQAGAFNPALLFVAVGTPITWINNDSVEHWPAPKLSNGQFIKNGFMPGPIPPGKSSPLPPYFPQQAGTINYGCVLHPNESGTLEVAKPE